MHRLRRWIARARPAAISLASQLVGIDTRALGVFRIGIGVLLLTDLAVRATDLSFFYSDDGVLPRALLVDRYSPWMVSVYVLTGAPAFVTALFAIAAIAAVCLLLGYRTRLAAFVSWVFLISLQNRDPLVNQNGDILLHLLLFWALFLPLGARYSIDTLRLRIDATPRRVVSFASFAVLAQVVMMYAFASLLKSGPDWTKHGTAVYYALQYKLLATPRAHLLLEYPSFLRSVTESVVWLERFGPILFFIPFVGAPVRIVAVFLFMSFHLGMSTFLALGPFMWVPEVALILLLPGRFWDWMERVLRRSGVSVATAKAGAIAARAAFLLPATLLLAVPGPTAHGTEQVYVSDASSSAEAPDVSTGRAGAGASHTPADARLTPVQRVVSAVWRGATSTLPILLIVYVFLLNMRTVTSSSYVVLPHLQWLGDSLSLNQKWNMFAPNPPHASGWLVIPGRLRNGRTIDLWRGPKPVTWKQPESIEAQYPNERWRKYAENLASFPQLQIDYARYLCRSWNTTHHGGAALDRFKIDYMHLATPARVGDTVTARRLQLVTWFCFRKPRGSV